MNNKINDFMELLSILKGEAEKAELRKKVGASEKKIVISIDDNATDTCGCVGVELQNVDKGSDLAVAAASLIATCIEHTKKGKEAETVTLILMLALEVFSHAKTKEEADAHGEEDLRKLEDLFAMFESKQEEDEEE